MMRSEMRKVLGDDRDELLFERLPPPSPRQSHAAGRRPIPAGRRPRDELSAVATPFAFENGVVRGSLRDQRSAA